MTPPSSALREGRSTTERLFYLGYALLIGGIALRIVFLDADPDYYAWVHYITDEGRWVNAARELALFGRIINVDWLFHLLAAPLFQGANYALFKLLGVSIWTARLVTALSGSALLIVFWLALRRVVTPQAMVVGLALLAFEVDLVMLSRVAIPEMPAMLLELLVYVVLVAGRPSWRRLFAAGLLLLATVAMKATSLPTVAIFSVIVLVQPLEQRHGERRWGRLMIFWAGGLAPILLSVPIWISLAWRHASVILSNTGVFGLYLGVSNPFTFVAFPFESDFAPVFNAWALGACFSMIGWLASEKETVEPRLRRYFVTSAIWYGMFALLMLSTYYFPHRYQVHILVPMAVNIATGISIVQGATFTKLRDALPSMTRSRRVLVLGLLSLPTAALWAPSLAGMIGFVGVDAARLRIKLACVAIALLGTAWVARRRALAGESVRFFFIFPIGGLLARLLFVRTGLAGNSFWPVAGGGGHVGWWSVGVPVAVLVSALLARIGRGWDTRRWVALVPAAALCYAVLSVVRVLPSYMHPHYSIKHTSEQLGLSLAGSPTIVASSRTEGLFNGNTLPYRAVNFRRWPDHKPEIIVIGFRFDDPEKLLGREYSLVATYRLFVSPEYEDEHSVTLDTIRHEEVVKVYRRNSAGMAGR
jgi:hypothetical protein